MILLLVAGTPAISADVPRSSSGPATCVLEVGDTPVPKLDCASGGTWRVRCAVPDAVTGRLRARLLVPERGLEAEAPVPSSPGRELTFVIAGPDGFAGEFLVRRGAGVVPGQAVGPVQLCPVVQPGVAPGAAPVELSLRVSITEHHETGFAEQPLDGGVVSRVPVYDAGRVVADGSGTVVQLPVRDVPIFEGTLPPLREEEVSGTLKLRHEGAWHDVRWIGVLRDLTVPTGDVAMLTLDFGAKELRRATGASAPARFLERDLVAWLGGGYDSLLGMAAWRRSELSVPVAGVPAFEDAGRGGSRRAGTGHVELRVSAQGDRVRVVIAHRAAPLDDAARAVIAAHAGD